MILVFIHLYDISSPSMAYFRVFPMCQNGIKSDGRRCQKGIESTRSMTTTAAKGANNPQKMSEFGADNATFMSQFPPPDHTFPEVLLGFLHIFPNKKPLSSGFLKSYLIAFSDSHFGITGFTSFGHSISMTTSSDDVGRSATK